MAIVYFRKIVFGAQDPPIDSYGSLVTKNSAQEARHQGLMELDLEGERFQSSETNELVKQQHIYKEKNMWIMRDLGEKQD